MTCSAPAKVVYQRSFGPRRPRSRLPRASRPIARGMGSRPDEIRVDRLQPVPARPALVETPRSFRHDAFEAQLALGPNPAGDPTVMRTGTGGCNALAGLKVGG